PRPSRFPYTTLVRSGETGRAAADPQVDDLVDRRLALHQHVLADEGERGDPTFHVGQRVRRPQPGEAQAQARFFVDQGPGPGIERSEEHTSELQSREN